MQRHQPAGRVVDEHQQRARRRAFLKPPVIAAVNLDQLGKPDAVTFVQLLAGQRRPEIGIALANHSQCASRHAIG
ncbi:hypothetical protein BCY88_09945 [Paraburkholderia fungorum]|uniref:Uncharacterized protein n=1 Tax=Paraburkholderia fungorum TaxID=134537 RepID=A0A3R7F3G1_9BURK|nr:hypothetical protein BCY88_09945 [Paraburkholderia fungorum]